MHESDSSLFDHHSQAGDKVQILGRLPPETGVCSDVTQQRKGFAAVRCEVTEHRAQASQNPQLGQSMLPVWGQ